MKIIISYDKIPPDIEEKKDPMPQIVSRIVHCVSNIGLRLTSDSYNRTLESTIEIKDLDNLDNQKLDELVNCIDKSLQDLACSRICKTDQIVGMPKEMDNKAFFDNVKMAISTHYTR